jgi:hypothetical protein
VIPLAQMNLFEVGSVVKPNILFPGDPGWWTALAWWTEAGIISADTETFSTARGKKAALHPWKNQPRLLQVGIVSPVTNKPGTVMLDFMNFPPASELQRVKVPKSFAVWKQLTRQNWWVFLQTPQHQAWFYFIGLLKTYVESKDLWVIIQNGMFDLLCWRVWWGWRGRSIFDTFVASNIVWAGLPVSHSLGAIVERIAIVVPGLTIKKDQGASDWAQPELSPAQINYAARDCEVLFPLAHWLVKIADSSHLTDCLWDEIHFTPALVEMEYNGLAVDTTKLDRMHTQYQEVYQHYYDQVNAEWKRLASKHTTLGTVIARSELGIDNKNDCAQLIQDLTGKTWFTTNSKGKRIPRSSDKETLLTLAKEYPILGQLSICRTIKKSLDKFESIKKGLRKHRESGHWVVSGALKQFASQTEDSSGEDAGAGTGRTGSGASGNNAAYTAPNIQNIPTADKLPDELIELGLPSIRECFAVTGHPHGCYYIHDLAAAHAREAAKLSRDPLMAEIYFKDLDAHAMTVLRLIKYLDAYDSNTMGNLTVADVKAAKKLAQNMRSHLQQILVNLRDVGKNYYYACLNGSGFDTLFRLFNQFALFIQKEKCEAAWKEFFELYAGLKAYLETLKAESQIPPLNFPPGQQTKRPRSAQSKWQQFNGKWYYPVQHQINGIWTGRVYREIKSYRDKQTNQPVWYGPSAPAIYSATWLRIETQVMKRAGTRFYLWLLEHPEYPVYLGNITHDELDAWSCDRYPEVAQTLIDCMNGEMFRFIAPIPAEDITKPTTPEQVMVLSWNDK